MSRILVCGGRNLPDEPWVYAALAHHISPLDTVITGGAPGADTIAAQFAVGLGATSIVFPADWQLHGRAAGPRRNAEMLSAGHPDLVLAFPGGKGTADMVRRAGAAWVEVVRVAVP